MAAGTLPQPGTKYGPCFDPCQHLDCAETRRMAALRCRICKEPIGYDDDTYHSRFYQEGGYGEPIVLVHADCREREVEAERK